MALAIGAHPDDIEFGCGGTLAKWAAAGCAIHHLVCTDGSKGTWDAGQDLAELVALRQAEQTQASVKLGGEGRVAFLGWVDGELDTSLDKRAAVAYWIRRVKPDVVLGHDPWKRYRLHPDHRSAGFLTTDGIVAARDPHFFPDQDERPHRPSKLLLWEADEPDHLEDITGCEAAKVDALLAHHSQLASTMGTDLDAFAARLRTRHAQAGATLGLPAAEAFKLISDL
ncbi:MAG: PIG-L family deacetylase [Acidimicrobiales bacterium]|nr:PIG-L family deacetylase [Acidimicrobiales bacterium]